MKIITISIGEPFTSPAWGSDFVMFSGGDGAPIAESKFKEYVNKACKYAAFYNVYLIPQRFLLGGYHSMCLIDAEGKVVVLQQALHLESGLGTNQGNRIEVFNTDLGGIFLCVDTDIYYPNISKIAANMGANIIFSSQYIKEHDYNNHKIIAGAWNVAQSNRVFVINANSNTNCVTVTREINKYSQGFIAAPSKKMPMVAKLDYSFIDNLPPRPKLSRRFYTFHQNELAED